MEEELKKLVLKAIEIAERTGEFVIEQAPDLLQEFYRWHIIKSSVVVLVGVFVMFVIFKIFKFFGKKEKERYYETEIFNRYYETDNVPFILLLIYGGGGFIFGIIVFFANLFNLLHILVAPKLYLIEYFLK